MGIIAILISILLPTLGRARESANRTACLSNLRQVHLAFHTYANSNRDQVPIGHRSASKQFNSMVYSMTAGGRWVLFGLLYDAGYIPTRQVLFCPSERNAKFMFDTPENPWPSSPSVPGQNIQSGYGARPQRELPDDLSNPPPHLRPFALPRLNKFHQRAIFADLTAARTRVITRHRSGINVLYGDGSARWIGLRQFDQSESQWPEPTFPPSVTFNETQERIWEQLDRVVR
jgi:prepilin-type processing-associated H-X9-DG protein